MNRQCIIAGGRIKDRIICPKEIWNCLLQLLVNILGSADKTYRRNFKYEQAVYHCRGYLIMQGGGCYDRRTLWKGWLSRTPSMMEAWFSSSLITASSAVRIVSNNPPFASKQETDGVFSMDGIICNLKGVCDLADQYNALVMVDDKHNRYTWMCPRDNIKAIINQ